MKLATPWLVLLALGGWFWTSAAAAAGPTATPGEIEKIIKAVPPEASAKPAKPRKLLIFTLALGFKHDSIPVCAKAMEILGKKNGAWESVTSDSMDMFEPETLKQFDAVFMCSTTGNLFSPGTLDKGGVKRCDRIRKSVLDFVNGGKGWGGSHAATDSCYDWPEYGDMIGGYFTGHPYGREFIKLDDPTSPLCAAFGGRGFEFRGETYVFGPRGKRPDGSDAQPYSRKKLHVLLSIDARNKEVPINLKAGNRADADYAISWIKNQGRGRVFYCSLGHDKRDFFDPKILRHYQDGIQFMLGDLKADATPSVK